MRNLLGLFLCLAVFAGPAESQRISLVGKEPPAEDLGAPLYPGAVFIRTLSSLDPYYESVMYVTPDRVGDVRKYFRQKLPKARAVRYIDENEWVWAFLLKAWICLPDEPAQEDLGILDMSPNVIVKKFQKRLHEPLIEYFEDRPEMREKLDALREARTIIRYTYRMIEEDIGFEKIRGTWVNVDRGMREYYGCIFRFNADSTYTITMTDENMKAYASFLSSDRGFRGKSPEEIEKRLRERNPETGLFYILRNTIDMVTDEPLLGEKHKSGLVEIRSFSLALQLINMPRLTFIRRKEQKEQ